MAGQYQINIQVGSRYREQVDEGRLQAIAGHVLAAEDAPPGEVGLVITGDRGIQELNRLYRDEDAPTDVLSFPFADAADEFVLPPEGPPQIGEIVISFPTARRQAEEAGEPLARALACLVVHGMLHLLGYDHEEPEQEQAMRAREKALLAGLE